MKAIYIAVLSSLILFISCQGMEKGKLSINGIGLANQEIQFIGRSDEKLLNHVFTDQSGFFDLPTINDPVDILFKIKADNRIGVYYLSYDKGATSSMEIDSSDFFDVKLNLVSEIGYPKEFDVFVDPISYDDVPEKLTDYFKMQGHGVASSFFFRKTIHENTITLKLRKGSYLVGGDYILHDAQNDEENYVVSQAKNKMSNESLPGDMYIGYRLDVNSDSEVELTLANYTE